MGRTRLGQQEPMYLGVKVFMGNVPKETSLMELCDLFEIAKPGKVLKVALTKQFPFMNMHDKVAAECAIHKLNRHLLHGHRIVVKLSCPRPMHTIKIFVGNVLATCTSSKLHILFQEFGPIIERDIMKDCVFVHMEKDKDARATIEHLNGREIKGKRINVELS